MAKTVTIKTDHEWESKGKTITVEEALKWVEDHFTDEEGNVQYSPGDLICIGVNRLKALHKDGKRHAAGKPPTHVYTARVDVKTATKTAEEAKIEAKKRLARVMGVSLAEPKPKVKKADRPAVEGSAEVAAKF